MFSHQLQLTPAVKEMAKGKVMPSPSYYVHRNIRTRGKAKYQEHSSLGVVHTRHSQGIVSYETNGKSSAAEEQVFVELTTTRVQQTKKKEEYIGKETYYVCK